MGYSLSWLAVRGKPMAKVLEELALRGTGRRDEVADAPMVGAELPGGWTVALVNDGDDFVQEELAIRLSAGCEVITCLVEEHVMQSSAFAWKNGENVWAAVHDAQNGGAKHLEAEGDFPAAFSAIREQDHMFDAPIDLAKAVTGFRHDQALPGGASFEALENTGFEGDEPPGEEPPTKAVPGKKSWFKKLFGG
jgi:hypothetical protein